MTTSEVRERVAAIERAAAEGDDEQAHTLEIELYRNVLRFYEKCGYSLAFEALKASEISFARWNA